MLIKNKSVLLIGFGTLIVALFMVLILKKSGPSNIVKSNPFLISELKKLESTQDPGVVKRAMILLRDQGAPEAEVAAIKRATHPNAAIRVIAAEVLGSSVFKGEAKEKLERLAKDPLLEVRMAALEAISSKREAGRVEFIKKHILTTNLSEEERELCHFGLYRISYDNSLQVAHFNYLHKKLASNNTATKSVIGYLIRMAPRDPELLQFLSRRLDAYSVKNATQTEREIAPLAYRHLAFHSPQLIQTKFSVYANHFDPAIKRIAFSTVQQICPPDRWKVLKSIVLNKKIDDGTKQAALVASGFLGGKSSSELASKFIASQPSRELATTANRVMGSASAKRTEDLCELRK